MANGLYTNSELLDSIIVDLNALLKALFTGQYVKVCALVTSMVQKLTNLRKTIDNDVKNREETIEKLKQALRNAGCNTKEMTPKEFVQMVGAENKEGEE